MLANVQIEEGFTEPALEGLGALDDVTNLIVPAAVGAAVYALAPRFKKSLSKRERTYGSIVAALAVLLIRR